MKIHVELYPYEYLRLMRVRLEMTQSMLAKHLGVTRQMVNYYENGIVNISPDRLDAVRRMADEQTV